MRVSRLPFWFLACFIGGSILSSLQRASGDSKPVTIVAFGDSTTALRGKVTVYSSLLQEELAHVHVINSGVGGNTTEMARQRFDKDVLAHQPQVAILQFGINDAAVDVWKSPPATASRVPLDRYEANLRYFIEALKSKGAEVILMTPNPIRWTPKLKEMYGRAPYAPEDPDGFNVLLKSYAETVRKLAQEENITLIDVPPAYDAWARANKSEVDKLLPDGMHPNDAGHRLVADLLRARLLDLAVAKKLAIAEGPRWQASGDSVLLNPQVTDITLPSARDTVLGSGLAHLKDGSVMAVYSTPSSYYSKPGTTWIAGRITKDGGKTWGEEITLARHPDCQPSHPSVLVSRSGVIHVFYLGFKGWKWQGQNPTPDTQSDVWTTRSEDQGVTWSSPQKIFAGYSGATNGAVETREGRLIVPYSHYVNDPGRLVSRVSVSADGGKTWELGTPLDIGGAGDHEGALEPAVLELKDGRVWMLIRTTRRAFWESFSKDGGLTWSPAQATSIESTSAPGSLARLADGRIALVWNKTEKARRQLDLALSSDEGRTWTPSLALAKGTSVTYPFVLEVAPGELWIGYHDVPKGWNFPRARQLRVPVSAVGK